MESYISIFDKNGSTVDDKLKQKLINLAQKYEVHDFVLQDPSQFLFWYDDFPEFKNKWKIETMEIDLTKADHIHLMINAIPTCRISDIIHNLKQISTFYAWKSHNNYLTNFYWSGKHNLWARGYFCTSISCVSETTLKHYIKNQG